MSKITSGVYLRISPSGKRYVGISWGKEGIEGRWRRENSAANNPNSPDYKNKLSGALRKHGANAFVNKILVVTDNKEYMKSLETQLIDVWNLKNDEFGYNMKDGGEGGGYSRKLTDEEKQARKQKMIDNGTWNKSNEMRRGVKRSDEVRKRISLATKEAMKKVDMKEICKNKVYPNGHPKTALGKFGKDATRYKPYTIENIVTGEVYTGSTTEIRRNLGVTLQNIINYGKSKNWIIKQGAEK